MRKRSRNPDSKVSSGLREKVKGTLLVRPHLSFTDLDWVDHFGSSMASGGEPEDRKITLDLNHLWIPRGGPTQ